MPCFTIRAGRMAVGSVSGHVWLNDRPVSSSLLQAGLCNYVLQDELLIECMTVKEALIEAAELQLREADGWSNQLREQQVLDPVHVRH